MAFGRLGAIGAGFGHLGAGMGPSGPAGPVGGAALLVGETAGFATDFTYATDTSRVALMTASVVTSSGLDSLYTNSGTSPKLVYDSSGTLGWSPHNMFVNSAVPATQSVTTVVGQNYTVTVTGSGSMTGSAGASGVATAASPLTYTATTATSTFTLGGSLTRIQMNRGAVATAHLTTTAAIRNGLAIDYDAVTHVCKGLLCEPAATNLLLNNAVLSTQSVTVTNVWHALSFAGTGTITLSGTSTAGPLTGTGPGRVSLVFTPTAGTLTLTVSGTVTMAQLEIVTNASFSATSPIQTFGASATRAGDGYGVTPAAINFSATAGSWWADVSITTVISAARLLGITSGSSAFFHIGSATVINLFGGTTLLGKTVANLAGSHKLSCAFQSADRAITADGLSVVTDALETANLLTPVGIFFGSAQSGSQIHGYIRKVRYVPRRKTGPEMVTETP